MTIQIYTQEAHEKHYRPYTAFLYGRQEYRKTKEETKETCTFT
jgi:hypothetical protein